MQQRALRDLFKRFREQGDVKALGEAFHRSAAELLGVARHLTGDSHDADDLVQATYLTAIEKIRTLEPERDPMPWLVGILTLHARNLRRKQGRSVDAASLERPSPTPPDVEAERAEFTARVREALAELPERYTAVLATYLEGERSSARIGRATGRAPGTVRMQIHRGLAHLRRSLASMLPFGGWVDRRRLATLERRVLEAATRARGLPAPVATSGLAPIAVLAIAALVVLGVGWAAYTGFEPAGAAGVFPAASLQPEPASAGASPMTSAFRSAVVALTAPRAKSVDGAQNDRGVRGRLLHADQSPAVGVEVRLVGIPNEFRWLDDLSNTPPDVDLERSRGTTGANGEFVLPGARRGDLNVLAIDCGGALGSLRQVDGAPDADGELDLGVVRLAATTELRGRIVDESGAPIPAGRIRVAPQSRKIASGFLNVAFGTRSAEGAWRVSEAPAWIRAWFEIFPTPTARSDSDGSFVLRAPGATAKLVIDAPDRAPREVDGIVLDAAAKELGDLVLASGRTVRGRVVDASGAPVFGAQVLVGARPNTTGPSTGLVACDPTDAQGRFERRGAPSEGALLIAARRSSGLAWSIGEFEGGEDVELVLQPSADLHIALRDDAGTPIELASLEIVAMPFPGSRGDFTSQLPAIQRTASNGDTLGAFTIGSYSIVARKAGHVVIRVDALVHAPLTEIELVLPRAEVRTVLVRDAASGEPVEDANVLVVNPDRRESLAQGRSDASGRVELAVRGDFANDGLQLHVRHAQFAPRRAPAALAPGEAQVVELLRGGSLVAQVVEHGVPVATRKTITLEGPEREGFPIQCSTDENGIARLEHLEPGPWKHQVSDAWSSGDALALWSSREAQEAALRRGAFESVDGQVAQLVIELDPSYAASTAGRARVHGRVEFPGADFKRMRVKLDVQADANHGFEHFDVDIDAQGRFDAGWIPSGRVFAQVAYTRFSELEMAGGEPWRSLLTLSEGEIRELDIVLQRTLVHMTVRDASGALAPDVSVAIEHARGRSLSSWSVSTNADGAHTQLLYAPGEHTAVAEHPTLGYARLPFTVAATDESIELELTLDPGVSIGGVLQAPSGLFSSDADRWLTLLITRVDDPTAPRRWLRRQADADGRVPFQFSGFAQGDYVLTLRAQSSTKAAPITFELGAAGASGIELVFELAQD